VSYTWGQPDEKPDWDLFKDLIEDFHIRYAERDNFNYRDMLASRKGGGPGIAPKYLISKDLGKWEQFKNLVNKLIRFRHPLWKSTFNYRGMLASRKREKGQE
jgi:hypothetical protein